MPTYCILSSDGTVLTVFANSQLSYTGTQGYNELPVDGGQVGQRWNGTVFVVGTPPPTVIYAEALAGGLTVSSAATPALDAVYSVGEQAQANIAAIAASIASGQGLPNAAQTIGWIDANGQVHTFTSVQFLTLADAVRNYVYNLDLTLATLQNGGTASWPVATATIP